LSYLLCVTFPSLIILSFDFEEVIFVADIIKRFGKPGLDGVEG
jgi:hypothetical protein